MGSRLEVVVENPWEKQQHSGSSSVSKPPAAHTRVQHAIRSALLSTHCQSALQLAVGMLVACLFTFIKAISFGPQSCVVATLFLVVSVMMSQNNHVGTRITAGASQIGSLWPGALAAAVVASLSKLALPSGGVAGMTAVQCLLGSAVLSVLVINRVAVSPPSLWVLGMTNCLAFGLVGINCWKATNITQVWQTAGLITLAAVVASCVAVLTASLVLPSLASEHVQDTVSDVLRCTGSASSRYAARLFRPDSAMPGSTTADGHPVSAEPTQAAAAAAAAAAGSAFAGPAQQPLTGSADTSSCRDGRNLDPDRKVSLDLAHSASLYAFGDLGAALVAVDSTSEPTPEEWLALIQRNSSPDPAPLPWAPQSLMPQLQVSSLRPRLAEATIVLAQAAAEPQWMRGFGFGKNPYWFDVAAWRKLIQVLLLLITRLSALEAVLEDGESLHETSSVFTPELHERLRLVYSQTATSLALMSATVKAYGQPQQQPAGQTLQKDSAAGAAASGPFCSCVGAFGRSWADAKAELATYMQQEQERYWHALLDTPAGSPFIIPRFTQVRHLMYTWCLTNGIIDTLDALEKATAAAVCTAAPPSLLQRLFGWTQPLLPLLTGQYLFRNWAAVLGQALPAVLREGMAGVSCMMAQRTFQAAAKYWLVLSLVLVATLLTLHFDPYIATLNPAFGYVAASLAMAERVEATVSKVAFWVCGTLAGGALGYVVMLHPVSATSPFILGAVMVGASFSVGLLSPTRARVAITLTLMALAALVLCQCCGHPGRAEIAIARVVSVIAGVLTSVAVCNWVLPWYTSSWAIEVMAATYVKAVGIVAQLVARSYEDGAAAVANWESVCVPLPASVLHKVKLATAAVAGAGTAKSDDTSSTADAATGSAAANPAAAAGSGPHSALHGCITYTAAETAAAAAAAEAVAAAAKECFPAFLTDDGICSRGTLSTSSSSSSSDVCSPSVLQAMVAKPLIDVQVSLLKDTVAWKRGVLATPAIVPRMLSALLALLDRLAAMQLAMRAPTITGRFTGVYHLQYAAPLTDDHVAVLELLSLLVAAVSAVLHVPSPAHVHMVNTLIKQVERQRVAVYRHMVQVRRDTHQRVLQQHQLASGTDTQTAADKGKQLLQQSQMSQEELTGGQQQQSRAVTKQLMLMLGGVDDVVRFLGFQFVMVKCCDKTVAAARVAVQQACQARNSNLCTLK